MLDTIGLGEVLLALLVALIGYYVVYALVPTIGRQRESIRSVSKVLTFHAPCIFNPGKVTAEKAQEASSALRELAAELSASTEGVRFYSVLAFLRFVRGREAVRTAHRNLIGLANSTADGDPLRNAARLAEIEDALGLQTELGYRWGESDGTV